MSIQIRLAEAQDLKELVEVLTYSFHSGSTLVSWFYPLVKLGISEDIRTRLQSRNPHYRCFAASLTTTHIIVGTVEISVRHRLLLAESMPYVANLAVSKEYRRQGIARQLLVKCEQIAQEWGFKQLTLHVLEDNMAAQELYFSHGYRLDRVEHTLNSWLFNQPRQLFLKKQLC